MSGVVEQCRKQQLRSSFMTVLFFQNEVLKIPLANVGQSSYDYSVIMYY